ncbi:CatA-like O-acetyltransferase [uncultured Pseudoteredinibacter sp.]|uniref:CatA-like O-acetyltransferase n=1 Tax=uncultured Pseudoteredinibacter sp. TaxID=1641701 RepID=UPI0026190AA7|nr:CatA-like O-acetyltransferase [uncultured Pseudoteredinibacter sp.]
MKIDIATWSRNEHFEFYRSAQEPYWGVCVELQVAKLYQQSKANGFSFSAALLFLATKAANQVENMRYRIVGNDVYHFETTHISNVFLRENKLFSFGFIEFNDNFEQHCQAYKNKAVQALNAQQIQLDEDSARPDTLHFSALPWLGFSSMSHARTFKAEESCPKISIGKLNKSAESLSLPFSVHVHHGFVDGYHMGIFIEALQDLINRF